MLAAIRGLIGGGRRWQEPYAPCPTAPCRSRTSRQKRERTNRTALQLWFAAALCGLTTIPVPALSQSAEKAIDRAVEAYGGDDLTTLRWLTISDKMVNFPFGYGYSPDYVEARPARQESHFDLRERHGSVEGWFPEYYDQVHAATRTVSTEDGIAIIDYVDRSYSIDSNTDFYAAFGAALRFSDTLLARELHRRRDDITYEGSSVYLGDRHDILGVAMPQSPPLEVYVSASSGWITKTAIVGPRRQVVHVFQDHRRAGGIGFASQVSIFSGGHLARHSAERHVRTDRIRSSIFAVDKGVSAAGPTVNFAEPHVEEVADGTYLTGQYGAYSLFYDAGDHVIAAGTASGFSDRLALYRSTAGGEKPLRYAIVTHHHADQIGGVGDALRMGAGLVVSTGSEAALTPEINEFLDGDRVVLVKDRLDLGPVTVHAVSTIHASGNALVYGHKGKTLFQAHHHTDFKEEELASADRAGVALWDAIESLDLDVSSILSANSPKVLSMEDFTKAVDEHKSVYCPMNRPICRDL